MTASREYGHNFWDWEPEGVKSVVRWRYSFAGMEFHQESYGVIPIYENDPCLKPFENLWDGDWTEMGQG